MIVNVISSNSSVAFAFQCVIAKKSCASVATSYSQASLALTYLRSDAFPGDFRAVYTLISSVEGSYETP